MFFWRADVLLDELRRHLPKTATILAALPRFGARGFAAALKKAFPLCENISIDYAVLEKASAENPQQSRRRGGPRFRMERRRKLERRLRTAAARRRRQRGAARLRVPGLAQQLRGCPRQGGGAAGREGPDRRGHAGCSAGGQPHARAAGRARSSRRWRAGAVTICCSIDVMPETASLYTLAQRRRRLPKPTH